MCGGKKQLKAKKLILLREYAYKTSQPIESLAGCVFFWPHHIILCGYLGYFVTHSICKQSSNGIGPGEQGILHAVISEETAGLIDMFEYNKHKKISVLRNDCVFKCKVPVAEGQYLTRWITYGIPTSGWVEKEVVCFTQPTVEMLMKSVVIDFDFDEGYDIGTVLLEPKFMCNDLFLGAQVFNRKVFDGDPCDDEMHKWVSRKAGN